MTEREKTIKEIIEYLKARPGRHVIKALERMITPDVPNPKTTHPWRESIK
jgi:hypothetical protein